MIHKSGVQTPTLRTANRSFHLGSQNTCTANRSTHSASQNTLLVGNSARSTTTTSRFFVMIVVLLAALLLSPSPALASGFTPVERTLPLVVDRADLLTASEEQRLIELFDRLSTENQCEIAVVTVHSLDGKSAMDYADDFFDYNGYGYGPDDDGILLLVSMDEREWWVTTHGTAYAQLTEDRLDNLMTDPLAYLKSGDYYLSFEAFGNNAAALMQMDPPAKVDYPSSNEQPNQPKPFVTAFGLLCSLGICLGVGAFVAMIATWVRAQSHRSVISNKKATYYLHDANVAGQANDTDGSAAVAATVAVAATAAIAAGAALSKKGSRNALSASQLMQALQLLSSNDAFISRSVSRTKRESSSSSGGSGGFGGHVSSSGRTHGGGGGHF